MSALRKYAPERTIRLLLLLQLLIPGIYFIARPAFAQTQEVINERLIQSFATIERRIGDIEGLRVDVRVMQDNMLEVKWLGRTVAAAVAGQLILQAFEKRKRGG